MGHFSSLFRFLWIASLSSMVSTAPIRLVSSANFLMVHSIPQSMSLTKMLEQHWSQDGPLWHNTHHWPPLGHKATDNNSLAANIQPILYPPNCPVIKSISHQFRDNDTVQDYIQKLSLDHRCRHSIIKSQEIDQAWSVLGESMLASLIKWLILVKWSM